MDLEPVREGKAHSTSELPRTPVKRSHTRSSSDSTRKLSLSARAGVRPLSSGSQTKFGTETQANVVTFTEASADVQTDQMSPQVDRKSTRLNSSHVRTSRMPSSA